MTWFGYGSADVRCRRCCLDCCAATQNTAQPATNRAPKTLLLIGDLLPSIRTLAELTTPILPQVISAAKRSSFSFVLRELD